MNASSLTQIVTFQKLDEQTQEWVGIATVYASMTGLKNSEYWINYIGGNADENMNVSVRYMPELMELIPQTSRLTHNGIIYDIISPPDDVLFTHREIKFRIRRQIS